MIKTKQILSAVLILFVFSSVQSQVNTGNIRSNSYKKKEVERFKRGKTTYFLFYEDFGFTKEQYEDVLSKSWNITPYQVVDSTGLYNNYNEENSFAMAYVYSVVMGRSVSTFPVMDFYSVNVREKRNGEKKYRRKVVASLFFTLNIEGRKNSTYSPSSFEGDLLNYNLGYLKNMLQAVNDLTKDGREFSIRKDFKNKEKLKALKNQTLYISDRFIYSYNPFKGTAKKKQITPDELFKSYKYKYEVIEDETLNEKILTAQENFYYLMYTQTPGVKVVTVVNGLTGEIIFQEKTNFSYNIKPKDIRQISNVINRS